MLCKHETHLAYSIPVSYTHLDVYKRQGLRGAIVEIGGVLQKLHLSLFALQHFQNGWDIQLQIDKTVVSDGTYVKEISATTVKFTIDRLIQEKHFIRVLETFAHCTIRSLQGIFRLVFTIDSAVARGGLVDEIC